MEEEMSYKIQRGNVFKGAMGILMIAIMLGATAPAVQAASCRNLGVYTDYFYAPLHDPPNAPAIWIWNGAVRPDPSKMTIYYYSLVGKEFVPPSDWGVRTDAPQKENSNGWYIYYIGKRFYQLPWNTNWNDDWRWTVTYCT